MDFAGNKFSLEKAVEADMARLSEEVKKTREMPEFKNAAPQEVIKQSLKTVSSANAGKKQDSTDGADTSGDVSVLPAYMKTDSPELRLEVERLVDVSLREGVIKATAEARKGGAFMIDALHDALIDKVYPELQKRGALE